MAILVVCPGCKARFQVSDQFAGKSGACPKCKATIKVPTKDEEVTIHAPEGSSSGGKTPTGQTVLKPIPRQETKIRPVVAIGIVVGVIGAVAAAWFGGDLIRGNMVARAIGLLILAPPLALGAYSVLRDEELEPYRGKALYLRTAICSLAYVGLWGVFAYVNSYGVTEEVWSWVYVAPPFVILGALAALACYDLDFGNGCFHYSFFLLVTILLARLAGMGWIWEAAK